jgi:Leucine-rich repeat (LRR) protein
VLNLENNLIGELPSEFSNLINLETIILNKNKLQFLPDFSKLKKLCDLDAYLNRIRKMPSGIDSSQNLTRINLTFNHLQDLGNEIYNCTNLTSLKLKHNSLSKLEPEIKNLTNLTDLNLDNNEIDDVPDEFINLVKLKKLSFNYNSINLNIGDSLTQYLDKNGIEVDKEFDTAQKIDDNLYLSGAEPAGNKKYLLSLGKNKKSKKKESHTL